MESVLTAFIIIFLLLFGVLTLSDAFVSTQNELADSWQAMGTRLEAQADSHFMLLAAEAEPGGTTINMTLRNTGNTKLADFDRWDVIIQYYDNNSPSTYHINWLPYTTTVLSNNQWTIAGIYTTAEGPIPEMFEPGIFNPGEEAVLRLQLAHPMDGGMAAQVALATTTGSGTSTVLVYHAPPALSTNTGLALGGNANVVITNSMLAVTDEDDSPAQLVYTLVSPPTQGLLSLGPTFTQEDINGGLLMYTHTGTEPDSFQFTVSDGENTIGTFTFVIGI